MRYFSLLQIVVLEGDNAEFYLSVLLIVTRVFDRISVSRTSALI